MTSYYAQLEADGAQLLQVAAPWLDGPPTVCLACGLPFGDSDPACTCTAELRSAAVAVLHQELVAGRDPAPALEAWRLARVASQAPAA